MDLNEIKEREKLFGGLWARMDNDKSLIENYQYIIRDFPSEGGKPIAKTYSVPVPLASTHHEKYKSKLTKLKLEYSVTTDDDEVMKDVISFLEDADAVIASWNGKKIEDSPLAQHIDWVCSRGWVCERNLWRLDEGKLITDTTAFDPRYVVWDLDKEGLAWVSVLSYRTPKEVNAQYGTNYTGDTLLEVRDCWTKDAEYVWVKDEDVQEQPNPYGFVPFIVRAAPWGPKVGSQDAMEFKGESIFYPHRSMYDEISYNASISKTEAREGLRPALQTAGKGPAEYPGGGDVVETAGVENELKAVPRSDMTQAQMNNTGFISAFVQQNTFGLTTYGSVTSPMSGTALDTLEGGSEEVLQSRKKCLEAFLPECAMMRVKQYVQLGEVFTLKKKHKPDDLSGDFGIECHLLDTSIDTYARRGQAAGSLMGIMPKKWIRNQIVGESNPEEIDNQVEREDSEQRDPIEAMIESIFSNIEKFDYISKLKALNELVTLETVAKQRMGDQGVPEPMTSRANPTRPMPANVTKPPVRSIV